MLRKRLDKLRLKYVFLASLVLAAATWLLAGILGGGLWWLFGWFLALGIFGAICASLVDLAILGAAIVAVDPASGEWGVAAVSRWIAVGARSLTARAGAGALAALELPDPARSALALDRLAQGLTARAALDSLLSADPRRGERQMALVDRAGTVAAHTGDRCPAWAGEWIGKGCVCQGIGLRDGLALAAMGRAFEATAGSLGERLLAALEAAEAVFPLRGPAESAAILQDRVEGLGAADADRLADTIIQKVGKTIVLGLPNSSKFEWVVVNVPWSRVTALDWSIGR
jgi:uncharacterized Ntn-hydrolase superfamily protein